MGYCLLSLQVVDKDPTKTRKLFDDTSEVEKYEMAESDYDKRTGQHAVVRE